MTTARLKSKRRAKFIHITSKTLISALIWFCGIIVVMPFFWMISTSFKGMNDVFTFPIQWIPQNPTLRGYQILFSGTVNFLQFFFNSVKIAAIALVGTFFSCTLAGYAYAKIHFKGRDQLFMLKLMTTMIPSLVTLLPTYILFSKMGILNTHMSLWLPAFFGGAFGVFLMRQAFMSFPDELVEAAKIDGAGHLRIWWNIALPNVRPSVATLLFMYFIWTWNDYEKPLLYLRSEELYTMPFAVKYFADEQDQNYPAIMAANVCMMAPIIIFFFTCQKFFVKSLVTSGLK